MHSMTGFGRATLDRKGARVGVEIRSVNHRFFKTRVIVPELLADLDREIEGRVRRRVARGMITIAVHVDPFVLSPAPRLNLDVLRAYERSVAEARKALGRREDVSLDVLLGLPQVWCAEPPPPARLKRIRELALKALDRALDGFCDSRSDEGKGIRKDLADRIREIEERSDTVRRRIPDLLAGYHRRLRDRAAALLQVTQTEVSPQDLARELALHADRCDVSEELQRIRTHVETFRKTMDGDGESGRRLEFLAQELLREVNTLGSKANDADLSGHAVVMKAELEKIREQLENVE